MTLIEERLGYRFQDVDLLRTALRHRSTVRDSGDDRPDNERLEFLGDAALGFLVGEALLDLFPDCGEGRLTKIKGRLVSGEGLFEAASALNLGAALELSPTEDRNGGREKRSILVDALEALIAAVYLDGGLKAARGVVSRLILDPRRVSTVAGNLAADNAKSTLQELCQARQWPSPLYRTLSEQGPPHDRVFHVEVLAGEPAAVVGAATGRTKRAAEQRAAREALARLAEPP